MKISEVVLSPEMFQSAENLKQALDAAASFILELNAAKIEIAVPELELPAFVVTSSWIFRPVQLKFQDYVQHFYSYTDATIYSETTAVELNGRYNIAVILNDGSDITVETEDGTQNVTPTVGELYVAEANNFLKVTGSFSAAIFQFDDFPNTIIGVIKLTNYEGYIIAEGFIDHPVFFRTRDFKKFKGAVYVDGDDYYIAITPRTSILKAGI